MLLTAHMYISGISLVVELCSLVRAAQDRTYCKASNELAI